jgi:histidine triad (HIT) family protein
MKKITKIIFVAVTSMVLLVVGTAWWKLSVALNRVRPCAFCDPRVLQTQTFYEDELVRGLYTYKPLQPGHCLVVVKRHIEKFEDVSEQEFAAVGRLLKKINIAIQKTNGPASYLILQKNGKEVGQSVPHVHFHYIPKKTSNNKLSAFGLLWDFICEPFRSPMKQKELNECVQRMHLAI